MTREICGITFAEVSQPAGDNPSEWHEVWRSDQYDITIKVLVGSGWTVMRAPGRNIVSAAPVDKAIAEFLREVAGAHAKTAPLIQHAVAWAAQDKETK